MSIPDRLSRIVRHKFNELKDRIDQMDEDAMLDPAELERLQRARARSEAREELQDALEQPVSPRTAALRELRDQQSPPAPVAQAPVRSPQQILESARSQAQPSTSVAEANAHDALDFHYRMLGLDPGDDLAAVQAAYSGLYVRTDPGRFPADSNEARELEDIRSRLEVSYRTLRDSLDSTAHRFGLLEFDNVPASEKK